MHIYIHIHTDTHIHIYSRTHICIHTYYTCAHTTHMPHTHSTHTCTYTHINTHTHTYTHARMHAHWLPCTGPPILGRRPHWSLSSPGWVRSLPFCTLPNSRGEVAQRGVAKCGATRGGTWSSTPAPDLGAFPRGCGSWGARWPELSGGLLGWVSSAPSVSPTDITIVCPFPGIWPERPRVPPG